MKAPLLLFLCYSALTSDLFAKDPKQNAATMNMLGDLVMNMGTAAGNALANDGQSYLNALEAAAPTTPSGYIWPPNPIAGSHIPVDSALHQASVMTQSVNALKVVSAGTTVIQATLDFNSNLENSGIATASSGLLTTAAGVVAGAALVAALPATATVGLGGVMVVLTGAAINTVGSFVVTQALEAPIQQMLAAWTDEKPQDELDVIYWQMAKAINEAKEELHSGNFIDGNEVSRKIKITSSLRARLVSIIINPNATSLLSEERQKEKLKEYLFWCWKEIKIPVDKPMMEAAYSQELGAVRVSDYLNHFNQDGMNISAQISFAPELMMEIQNPRLISTWDVKCLERGETWSLRLGEQLNLYGLELGPFKLPSPVRLYTHRCSIRNYVALDKWQTVLKKLKADYQQQAWPNGLANCERIKTTASRYYGHINLALHNGEAAGQYEMLTNEAFQMLMREAAATFQFYKKLIQAGRVEDLPRTHVKVSDYFSGMTIQKVKDIIEERSNSRR